MKDRKNLTMSPEVGLKNAITNVDKIDEYGHLVNVALHKVLLICHFLLLIVSCFEIYYRFYFAN